MSVHRDLEDAADQLRSIASKLRAGSYTPEEAISKLRSVADEIEDLARKVKRAASNA